MNEDGTQARRECVRAEIADARERAARATGWLFGDLRATNPSPTPWSYEAMAGELVRGASRVLDLGTGGGERLAVIILGSTARVVATEEWQLNAPVAYRRLRPLGVPVVRCSSLAVPFAGASFDLVLDRHEALDPAEVARLLAPGGVVLTQQVGPHNWPELTPYFPEKVIFEDHFELYQGGFRDNGLAIDDVRWHDGTVAFERLSDLVFMLLVAPWEAPGFDPGRDVDRLIEIEDALRREQGIVLTEPRYLIRAHKPG
ncbi:MAG TPA: methyltransferase domain-containing protein [Dehalococcoidia bacterium]|jgi:SAM-dependent methyltransferase|nr:methyltransferase domain-containing protein [Dehalococcoidia bacterium]